MDGKGPRECLRTQAKNTRTFKMHMKTVSLCPHQRQCRHQEHQCCPQHHHDQARTVTESVLEKVQEKAEAPCSQWEETSRVQSLCSIVSYDSTHNINSARSKKPWTNMRH